MRRIYHLLLLALIVNLSAFSADFKVGDFKYEVLKDGTVEIKDAKKATGDYTIESTVTDSKSGKSYTVSSIGEDAFKKSSITSITMPESVKVIGKRAFKECKNLTSVTLSKNIQIIPPFCFDGCTSLNSINLKGITTIGTFAFSETGLSDIIIPASVSRIERRAFVNCRNLNQVVISNSYTPLEIGPAVFFGSPLKIVFAFRDIYNLEKYENPDNFFGDTNFSMGTVSASKKWFDTNAQNKRYNTNGINSTAEETTLIIGGSGNLLSEEFVRNIPNIANVLFIDKDAAEQAINVFASLIGQGIPIDYGPQYSDWEKLKKRSESAYGQEMQDCKYNVYFGLDDNFKTIQEEPFNIWEGITTAYANKRRLEFIDKWAEFVRVAEEEPDQLRSQYSKLQTNEVVEYKDIVKAGTIILLDSVYLVKPTLTEAEINNIKGFINNEFHFIGYDYGVANLSLEDWAKYDLLNMDLQSGAHKEDYERILKSIDRFYTSLDSKEDHSYHQAMQLAALCGLERWKEAAAYFPKVHCAVTDNGRCYQLELPYEITYMQKAINDHGYKAVAPTYKKATSKNSSAKSADNGSLTQFFMEAAINAGIDHYKKKKREKKARELFYESMGLDKKGRPKK